MRSSSAQMLPLGEIEGVEVRWFSGRGCVEYRAGQRVVFVGGAIVGTFTEGQEGPRNVLVVQLAQDPKVTLGKLAWAFDISQETLRLLRRADEEHGPQAVWGRAQDVGDTP